LTGYNNYVITRRKLLIDFSAAFALAASCRRRPAFSGYAFVANQEGHAIAAVDLGVFAVTKHIPVNGSPSAVIAGISPARVYALTPNEGRVHEILTDKLAVSRTTVVARQAVGMRLSNDGKLLYVLCADPRLLVTISADSMRIIDSLPLPAVPFDFDVSRDEEWVAISYGAAGFLQLIEARTRQTGPRVNLGGEAGLVRFQADSSQLIAANLGERMLHVYQSAAGRRLVVRLPLALRPDHFCFNADGGQLFVTGEGLDAVVVVYPYFTPQIGETVLAGHAPGAMAVTPEFLFVANSRSGDVSILDAVSKRVIAVAPAGASPACIAVTPDDQYALVLCEGSGDMAVIWIPGLKRSRPQTRTAALFTMIPVGSKPVSAAVVQI
jgi:YVTN family beta-propeller protein